MRRIQLKNKKVILNENKEPPWEERDFYIFSIFFGLDAAEGSPSPLLENILGGLGYGSVRGVFSSQHHKISKR